MHNNRVVHDRKVRVTAGGAKLEREREIERENQSKVLSMNAQYAHKRTQNITCRNLKDKCAEVLEHAELNDTDLDLL